LPLLDPCDSPLRACALCSVASVNKKEDRDRDRKRERDREGDRQRQRGRCDKLLTMTRDTISIR